MSKLIKKLLVITFLGMLPLLYTGCDSGEANYSLEDVLKDLNNAQDLINGDITFSTPSTLVVNDQQSDVTTVRSNSPLNLEYSIVGGDDKELFIIDPRTGKLSFKTPPLYDAQSLNTYDVIIGVTTLSGELSTHAMLIVVVADITKEKPLVDYVVDRVQAVLGDGPITQINARPADESSSVTFALTGSDKDLFEIDKEGVITFKKPLPIIEDDTAASYSVSAVVTDGYGNQMVSDPITISIVANPDKIQPIIMTKSIDIVENSLGGIHIEVSTPGTGVVNQYLLDGTDKALFEISDTGLLSLKEANDYESAPNTFHITLQVGDDKENLSEVQAIVVNIKDLDEGFTFEHIGNFTAMVGQTKVGQMLATPNTITNVDVNYTLMQGNSLLQIDDEGYISFKSPAVKTPSFYVQVKAYSQLNGSETLSDVFSVEVVDDPSKVPPSIDQNYPRSTSVVSPADMTVAVMKVQASAEGNATTLSYTLNGVDATMFTIDENGSLFFASGIEFDPNIDNIYEVVVDVSDEYGNEKSTEVISVVVLENPDTMIPIITSSTFSVDENSLGNLTVTDFERGSGKINSYSIVGGADSALFTYDNKVLRFKSAPDFESEASANGTNTYNVTLEVSDDLGNISEPREIIVNVQDVNEKLTFTSLVNYNQTEGTTYVGTVTAGPVLEMPAEISYSLVDSTDTFTITAAGALSFIDAPVYVSGGTNIYTVSVAAQSQYNGSLTTQDITVKVFSASYAITFDSNQSEAWFDQNVVMSFPMTATSAAGETLTYSIEDYTGPVFSIDAITGLLTVSAPAYSWDTTGEANTYRATVVATDTNGNSARRQGVLYINSIDGTPSISTSSDLSVNENVKSIVNLAGSSLVGGTLNYSVTGGADANTFDILNNLTLVFKDASGKNFEVPNDANTDNVYEVEITATDSVSHVTTTKLITVSVNNVTELPINLLFSSIEDNDGRSSYVNIADTTHLQVDSDTSLFFAGSRRYKVQLDATAFSGQTLSYVITSNSVPDVSLSLSITGLLIIDVPKRLSPSSYASFSVNVCETAGECNVMTLNVAIIN